MLKNEEGKEGQGSSIGDHKVYSIDGQQVTVLSATGGESNTASRSNSFASGWMFRLFEEAILGALCGKHGRRI
jgi:hypothetical protein